MSEYWDNRIIDHTANHIKQHHETWKQDIVEAYRSFLRRTDCGGMTTKMATFKARVYALDAANKHVMQASREVKDPWVKGLKSQISAKLRDEALKDV